MSDDGFLEHVKALRAAVAGAGGDFLIAGDTLQSLVRHGKHHWLLHPQFVTALGGALRRTPALHGETVVFAGWRPYQARSFPLAVDRGAFRDLVRSEGLSAPELSREPGALSGPVLVSRVTPEGRRLEGPFRTAVERRLESDADAYEPFVRGDFLKVWFLEGSAVCAERERLPVVIGDGVRSLRELLMVGLAPAPEKEREVLVTRCELVARAVGMELSTVLPKGVRQAVAVGYGATPLHGGREGIDLAAPGAPDWCSALQRAGAAVARTLPEGLRVGTVFTLDAILDESQRPWLLDVDCNPLIHPLVYRPLIAALVAAAPADAAAALA